MSTLLPSGMEMMFLSSAGEWERQGYTCDIVGTAREIGPLAPRLRASGYGIFHIPFRGRRRFALRTDFIPSFYRLCASGYDVIHLHVESITPLLVLIARAAGIRIIALTPHNTFRFTGLLRIRKRWERAFIRLLGGRYGMISEGVKACEWERFRNPGVRISNWLDTVYFRPPTAEEQAAARGALGCEEGQFVFASVANCAEFKNHRAILQAVPLLPPTMSPLYLHIGREEEHRPELALTAELGIGDRVRFLGSQSDPRAFFWAVDAFVMPSLFEGLGISAIEAIASAVPAVLADVDGLADVIAETQFTAVTSTDATSIAKGLAAVAALPTQERARRALVDSGQIRKRFSMQAGVRSIIDGLYQR